MDNINVDEEGAVCAYVNAAILTLVDFPTFGECVRPGTARADRCSISALHRHSSDPSQISPVVIYRIRNETSQDKFFGKKYEVEPIFSDDGHRVSGTTNVRRIGARQRRLIAQVVSYKNKLYLTGVTTKALSVCEL